MNETPRIVSAAMLMDDGLVVPGVRHLSPDMRKVLHRIYGDGYHLRIKEQGFIDASGAFLNRSDAWMIAEAHDQIFLFDPGGEGRLIPLKEARYKPGLNMVLFSENLY